MKTYKSSINFKKSVGIAQIEHNENLRPGYRISDVGSICDRTSEDAIKLRNAIIDKAIIDYSNNCKAKNKRFQATSYEYSAVANIKPDTSLDDLQRLADYFATSWGFQCIQISIHRDEGHIDIDGKPHINQHAHLEFITLDRDTGANNYRKINKSALRKIQDKTAEILGMERGEYIENSKVKRIEPRAYAQLKEQEKQATKELKADLEKEKAENKALKQDLVNQKAVNTAFEEIRQLMIADGISTADDYKELAKYKKEALAQAKSKELTKEQLDNQIAQIQQSYNEKLKAKDEKIEKLEKAKIDEYVKSDEMERSNEELLESYLARADTLENAKTQIKLISIARNFDDIALNSAKNTIIKLREELKKSAPNSQNKADDVKDRIIDLEKQNKDLKADNDTLTLENQTMKSELSYIKQFLENNKLVDMVKNFFSSIGKKLSMEFEEPKSQAPQSAEQKQDIQLTPKADIQRNTSNQNKGRGGI